MTPSQPRNGNKSGDAPSLVSPPASAPPQLLPDRLALDFSTDMTRVSQTIRLAVLVRSNGKWIDLWRRTYLEADELALCNLATWPELRELNPLIYSTIEALNTGAHTWTSIYSALHLTPCGEAVA